MHKTSLGRSTIYKYLDAKAFPKKVSIGANRVAWLESEIDEWMEKKLAQR